MYNLKFFILTLITLLCSTTASSSTKERQCDDPEIERLVLITGCGRSGTTFISRALTGAGLDVRHEYLGKDGSASWYMNVENANAPYGCSSTVGLRFTHIFHQVRHPLKTIASINYSSHASSFAYVAAYVPEIDLIHDSRLVQTAKYWYYWNLLAEAKAEWRYRIEDIDLVWDEIGQRLGVYLDPSVLSQLSRKTNTRGDTGKLTWKQLKANIPADLFADIQSMALRYGYSIVDE